MAKNPAYTQEEDALIRKHYVLMSNKELLSMLSPRTRQALRQHAHRLGVKKSITRVDWRTSPAPRLLIQLTDTEKAYLAGIIDGEGTITLSRGPIRKNGRRSYSPHVAITTTSPSLEAWLLEKLPGVGIYRWQRHANHREIFQWSLYGARRVPVLLQEVLPYLVIKRKQADLLFGGYVHLDDVERAALWQALHDEKKTA